MAPPRSHPLAVSRTARLADRAIDTLWSKRVTDKPPLEPDYLWQVGARGFAPADEKAGRSDSEVADFRERLSAICTSLRAEANLNALGHTLAYGQLTAAIRNRHALGRLWRARPELLETSLAAPIVVVGQMRAGTTRIHRLLAADPAHAGTRFCDSFDPVPRVAGVRPVKAAFALAIARRINPWLDSLHPFGVTRPDEEIGWLSAALSPCAYEAQWHIPGFVAWSEARDPAPVYAEFTRILRTDAAVRGNGDRPRVLKCPQFSEDLAALSEALPDARLVVARRATQEVLGSTVSMVAGQSAFQSDCPDLETIRTEWTRKLALREVRLESGLAGHPAPFTSIQYEALNADWVSAIGSVYAALGLRLSEEARAAMGREQRVAAHSPHHAHAADVREFARL